MLFKQGHTVDGHAPVHGFAHVIDGEQRHLHGGQSFHLHTGLAHGLGGSFVFDLSNFSSTSLKLVGQNWDKISHPFISLRNF